MERMKKEIKKKTEQLVGLNLNKIDEKNKLHSNTSVRTCYEYVWFKKMLEELGKIVKIVLRF